MKTNPSRILKLSKRKIQKLLNNDYEVIVFDEIDSTNNYAKNLLRDNFFKPALIIADKQTAGRGRQGKSFYSPSSGLYMTLLLPLNILNFNPLELTIRAAVAIQKSIFELTSINVSIKWVNDIFFNNRKIGGILAENVLNDTFYILGIGINIITKVFPEELQNIAGALNHLVSRNILASKITINLLDNPQKFDLILQEYEKHLFIIGKRISFEINGEIKSGIVIGLNEKGNLIIDNDGDNLVLSSGEISLGNYNIIRY